MTDPQARYLFARHLVKLHDEQGFPFEISCIHMASRGERIDLFGVTVEIAARKMGAAKMREFARIWSECFEPVGTEVEWLKYALRAGE